MAAEGPVQRARALLADIDEWTEDPASLRDRARDVVATLITQPDEDDVDRLIEVLERIASATEAIAEQVNPEFWDRFHR